MHRTNETRGHSFGVMLTATLLAVGLTACSPNVPEAGVASADALPTAAVPGQSDEERQLAYTRCMRENGVEIEDGGDKADTSGEGESSANSMKAAEGVDIDKASEACGHLAPAGHQEPAPSPAELAMLRSYAACLRDNGLDVADPDPQTGAIKHPDDALDSDPAAYDACEHVFGTETER